MSTRSERRGQPAHTLQHILQCRSRRKYLSGNPTLYRRSEKGVSVFCSNNFRRQSPTDCWSAHIAALPGNTYLLVGNQGLFDLAFQTRFNIP